MLDVRFSKLIPLCRQTKCRIWLLQTWYWPNLAFSIQYILTYYIEKFHSMASNITPEIFLVFDFSRIMGLFSRFLIRF